MNREYGGPTRLGLLVIGLMGFLLLAGLLYFVTGGLRSGGDDELTQQEQNRRQVTTIHSGRSVRMTVYGPVVANEDRESYEVSVSPSTRRFVAYKGYNQTQVESYSYDNSFEGYQQFVHALSRAGFDKERKVSDEQADDRGACSSGKRYVYELFENGDMIKRVWTTTCGNTKGTYAGTNTVTKDLFNRQIPQFSTVIRSLKQFR